MLELIIILIAGIGAGIVTGLVGASAVILASTLFIIFLDYPAYLAIGLALSIGVFTTLFTTLIYHKNRRIRIKPTLILLISSLIAVIIGSYFSKNIPSTNLGLATGVVSILAGISIILKKDISNKKQIPFLEKNKTISLILIGLLIGTIAGVFGTGGGIIMLLILIFVLDYKIHEAVGTSVFLMMFITLVGGIVHYYNMPFPILSLVVGAIGGIIGAVFASKFANALNEKTLIKLVGLIITGLGILLILNNLFF
mgnify:CR=1 FL=1